MITTTYPPLDLDRRPPATRRVKHAFRHLIVECLPGCLVIHTVLHILGIG